jgi:hypothetical protein
VRVGRVSRPFEGPTFQPSPEGDIDDRDAERIEFCRLSLDEFFSPTEAEVADSLFIGWPTV